MGFLTKKLKGGRRGTVKRATGTRGILAATGVISGSQAGAGRPKGSYKYRINGKPVSVYTWRKHKSKMKNLYSQYQQQEHQKLRSRGFGPEQIDQLRRLRAIQRVKQGQSPVPVDSVPDNELKFREWLAKNTTTPNTQRQLDEIRRIQLKGKSDNIEMQRRIKERKMVESATSILATPFIFKDNSLDVTGVDESNILMAQNVFKERLDNPSILRARGRHILDTGEDNTLKF